MKFKTNTQTMTTGAVCNIFTVMCGITLAAKGVNYLHILSVKKKHQKLDSLGSAAEEASTVSAPAQLPPNHGFVSESSLPI